MSSNPGYRPSQRIVPIPYAGYRSCVECELTFYPESGTQVMCRLCQVELSHGHARKPNHTIACHECGSRFTVPAPRAATKFCSDACRYASSLKRKVAAYAARKEREPLQPRACKRDGCAVVYTPMAANGRYCSEWCRGQARMERDRAKKEAGA